MGQNRSYAAQELAKGLIGDQNPLAKPDRRELAGRYYVSDMELGHT
jgi:hypothetical protein